MNPEWREKLRESLVMNEPFFSRPFSAAEIVLFCRYYDLVLKWNDRLPLTTITSPQEFAERNLLEAAFSSQKILQTIHRIWDIGSGCGIPGIPFAILRPDLKITLVESSRKKSIFLREVISQLGIVNVDVLNQRFETVKSLSHEAGIATRALDALSRMAPKLFNLGQSCSQILLLGNDHLCQIAQAYLHPIWKIQTFPVPNSKTRILISCSRFT
jgi:16S rRNA (guanine(527)-N(7))-methyltransferase RsmG